MNSFKKLLLKYKTTPDDIANFCINNSKFCKEHKDLLCQSILKSAGYKVSKEYDGYYCKIYKELVDILGHEYGNKYLQIENAINCNRKCSDILIKFLNFNKIKIVKTNTILQLQNNSRATVKIIKNNLSIKKPTMLKRETRVKPRP